MAAKSVHTRWLCATLIVLLFAAQLPIKCLSMNMHDDRSNKWFTSRACDEIYVVGEGETLHTISEKCDDPFIVERNPHIHDPDDVFPGLVINITPFSSSRNYN
ncbi:hypothetical protein CASFOL_005916 [Castilleja foliolosa]|uniref:LysM domain-containing protein n=1 Tax=Castilleja foliolosa TaxID=1961234 RepID=A0ABD3E4V7_9LAMI